MLPPTIAEIKEAKKLLSGIANTTPLIKTRSVYPDFGQVFIKSEINQKTRSFKFRGAYNKINSLNKNEKKAGVTAYSSGNHGQAVACVANLMNIDAVIVMPNDAPKIKLLATKSFGAEIITYDRSSESREDIARTISKKRGMTIIPPFDDPMIIAGQGTIGLEISEELTSKHLQPDVLAVPASGGGLASGCAIAIKDQFPDCRIFCVEPENFNDISRSLVSGRKCTNSTDKEYSICDALLNPTSGEITFPIMQKFIERGLTVSDNAVREAMKIAWETEQIMLEPSGAAALAALTSGVIPSSNVAVIVCSGGNVDKQTFQDAIKS